MIPSFEELIKKLDISNIVDEAGQLEKPYNRDFIKK
jgi:hypothetical protein